jgi:UDP-N-acetylmuramoyl-L-alanyl-D-glutamate--2,6-diaminopimelate ligase
MERRLSEFFTGDIAEKAGFISRDGDSDPLINFLSYDSRKVEQGHLFFALPGLHTDGSLYIEDAINHGAAAVVYQADLGNFKTPEKIPFIKVANARFSMSPIAASFYDFPSRKMFVTGITGTDGKTTTTYLTWQLLTMLGKKAGFFNTVQHCYGGEVIRNIEHQTTPEAVMVQKHLWEMANNGCEYAVIESSSHALSEKTNRLGDVEFCAAILTNVTHEHLEFHGTWEKYRDDKANLFRALDRYVHNNIVPFGVINADDKNCRYFCDVTKRKTYLFSTQGNYANLEVKSLKSTIYGNWYNVRNSTDDSYYEIRDRLPGHFNANNVLAAALAVSGLTNIPIKDVLAQVKNLEPVHGRMSYIIKGQPFEILIDYAHTSWSYRLILSPLRKKLDKTGGKIITLFGSGGERDTIKRPEQGRVAAEFSDYIILTDEDPRGEPPQNILEQIAKGVEDNSKPKRTVFKRDENLFLIQSRPQAVHKAISLARPGDAVMLFGKGHENNIIYAQGLVDYYEYDEVDKALVELGLIP